MLQEKSALLKEVQKQGHYPTGGDPYIHAFFKTLLKTADSPHSIINLLIKVQRERRKVKHYLTKAHAVYLPVHIINYIMIFLEGKPDYPYTYQPSLLHTDGWEHLIHYILQKYQPLFLQFLHDKDVQQNVYQRGISIAFLINTLLKKDNLKVADLGCSANLVWGSIMSHNQFQPVTDHIQWKTQRDWLFTYASKPVSVAEMKGLDYRYPLKTPEGKHWLLACRHPKEVTPDMINQTRKQIEAYEHLPHIAIYEGDFSHPQLKKNYFDVVTMNNTLYQLPDRKRQAAIKEALSLLQKEDGLLIIQDNCRVESKRDGDRLAFTDSRKYYTYRTCLSGPAIAKRFGRKWLELFRFKTTRCREVKPGKDFNAYMSGTLA